MKNQLKKLKNQKKTLNRYKLSCALFSLLFLSFPLHQKTYSYIPKLSTILSRTTENNGEGLYLITQDLIFKIENTSQEEIKKETSPNEISIDKNHPATELKKREKNQLNQSQPQSQFKILILREHWMIKNENRMRLYLKGLKGPKGYNLQDQIRGTLIYDKNNRHFTTNLRTIKTSPKAPSWFEDFFHFRSYKNMLTKMENHNILSTDNVKDVLKREDSFKGKEEKIYSLPSYLWLSRIGGVVAYAIGEASLENRLYPSLWIEQDRFVIRKIRLHINPINSEPNLHSAFKSDPNSNSNSNSNININSRFINSTSNKTKEGKQNFPLKPTSVEIIAKDYTHYRKNFHFPKLRIVKWNKNKVIIKLISVKRLRPPKKYLSRFHPKSLKDKKNPPAKLEWEKIAQFPMINEFYTLFR